MKESTFESAKILIIISCASVLWVITRSQVSESMEISFST